MSTRRRRHARRAASTATARTRSRCPRGSRSPGCRCSTGACVWALVHPRGGGELGRRWYLDGKLLAKRNTFTDTLAACDHLVDAGVAAPRPRRDPRRQRRWPARRRLRHDARPNSSAPPSPRCPFVDVVTTMSDPSLPLTVTEWEEWGDPREPSRTPRTCSATRRTTTRSRDRLPGAVRHRRAQRPARELPRAGEVGRPAARGAHQPIAPLLLRTEMGAGHAGPSGRYDAVARRSQRAHVPAAHALSSSAGCDVTSSASTPSTSSPALRAQVLGADRLRRPRAEAGARRPPALRQPLGDQCREQQQQHDRHERGTGSATWAIERGADAPARPTARRAPGRTAHRAPTAWAGHVVTGRELGRTGHDEGDAQQHRGDRRHDVHRGRQSPTWTREPLAGADHFEPRTVRQRALALATKRSIWSSPWVGSWWNSASVFTPHSAASHDGVVDRAMPPRRLHGELLGRVLRVVDQQVGAFAQLAGAVGHLEHVDARLLVVAQVGDRGAAPRQPVAARVADVRDRARHDLDRRRSELLVGDPAEVDRRLGRPRARSGTIGGHRHEPNTSPSEPTVVLRRGVDVEVSARHAAAA